MPIIGFIVVVAVVILFQVFKILNEYERGVIFRLGRLVEPRGPGLIILIPFVEKNAPGGPAYHYHGRAGSRCDYARQCFGQGQCGGLFPSA